MSETVNLPALGESVTEGTVTRWLVEVGEEVDVDQPIVEVSTDKVDTEVPSPVAGVIEELLVGEDDTVEVGAPLVKIGDGSAGGGDDQGEQNQGAEEAPTEEAPAEQPQEQAPEEKQEKAPAAETSESGGEGEEVTLPALGESVTEGTVTRWLVEVGDDVDVDQPLLEVSTDKVDTEVPSPVAGTVQELKVSEDETVEVGAVLAVIGSGAPAAGSSSASEKKDDADSAPAQEKTEQKEAAPEDSVKQDEPEATEEAPQKQEPKPSAPAAESSDASAEGYVTPLVRRLAKREGVDLSSLKGTGVGGRIRKQDVIDAAEAKKSQSAPASSPAPAAPPVDVDTAKRGKVEKAPRIRQVIAERMVESLQVGAQLTQVHEVDMTRIVNLRARSKNAFKQANGVNLNYLSFISVAVTEALKQHPTLNAEYNQAEKQITYHDAEHLSFAVDTDKGLMVPVISDAGDLNLAGMAKKIADVAARTRSNKIAPDELSGGTFTITNLGSFGALTDTPIINQPQVAILGPGAIVKRPMVVTDDDGNDSIGIRHMMNLSLTYDHRLVDGADAGRFMQTLKARLEGGEFEAQLGL